MTAMDVDVIETLFAESSYTSYDGLRSIETVRNESRRHVEDPRIIAGRGL